MRRFLPALIIPMISLLLVISFGLAYALTAQTGAIPAVEVRQTPTYRLFMAMPKIFGVSTSSVASEDGTELLVCRYLNRYQSPMAKTCREFTGIFQSYRVDPILALAIAQCESNLGKKMPIPVSQNCYEHTQPGEESDECCHNPFGWGVHSAGTLCFNTWQEGYQKVALGLRQKYYDQGLDNVEDIMSKYNKISAEERNGSWGKCVSQFIGEIGELKIRKN